MIDGKYTEFVDLLSYGEELVFIYKEQKYFLQGWWNDEKTQATMVLTTVNEDKFDGYTWECQKPNMSDCADTFLSEPLWDGKDFNQIQNEVTWSDW